MEVYLGRWRDATPELPLVEMDLLRSQSSSAKYNNEEASARRADRFAVTSSTKKFFLFDPCAWFEVRNVTPHGRFAVGREGFVRNVRC